MVFPRHLRKSRTNLIEKQSRFRMDRRHPMICREHHRRLIWTPGHLLPKSLFNRLPAKIDSLRKRLRRDSISMPNCIDIPKVNEKISRSFKRLVAKLHEAIERFGKALKGDHLSATE